MIDFRYHIVSLISVFLALAVGIVLGAGPLKEAIGDTLTGEVEQLRSRAADLRDELDDAGMLLARSERALDAVAPDLLDGVLAERRVAVVVMGDTEPDVLTEVNSRLLQSGAQVSAYVQITDAWMDPETRAFRRSLTATLVGYLQVVPAPDAGTAAELAEALAQGLTMAEADDPDVLAADAGLVLELLSEAELISLDSDVTQPADAIVFVLGAIPGPTVDPDEDAADAREAHLAEVVFPAAMQIALAAQERSTGAVVAAVGAADQGLLELLLDDNSVSSQISSVALLSSLAGQVSVPLALSARIDGSVGHYGPGDATAPMPRRVVLPPIDRRSDAGGGGEQETPPEDGDGG